MGRRHAESAMRQGQAEARHAAADPSRLPSVIALLARRLAAARAGARRTEVAAGALRRAALRLFRAIPLADLQLLLRDPHLLQVAEGLGRHAFRQVDQAVVVADADAADELRLDTAFVGDGAHDVARLHAMLVADFDAVGALAVLGDA